MDIEEILIVHWILAGQNSPICGNRQYLKAKHYFLRISSNPKYPGSPKRFIAYEWTLLPNLGLLSRRIRFGDEVGEPQGPPVFRESRSEVPGKVGHSV